MEPDTPWGAGQVMNAGRVTLAVRVKPGSSRARVGGRHDGSHGPALVVAVTERAVDGAATEAVLRAVARALGVRPADVTLHTGRASRDKILAVDTADRHGAEARIAGLRDGSGP
ncbi:MAG: uncharacterized protein QOJ50_1258 [Cryptosporangiaceae bacterium]|nr:uncharacterized protein [Cryptosporangiaceae bacterium]